MKKITLIVVTLLNTLLFAQTYDSGVVNLNANITARVQTNTTTVTLTVTGPSDRWFSVGFGTSGMSSGDCLVFTNSGISDRTFVGFTTPSVDTNNWTLISNTTAGGIRTIVGTRNLVSSGDYTFSNSNSAIPVVWAFGASASYSLAYHNNNRGTGTINTTLNNNEFILNQFQIFPNPVIDNLLNIILPSEIGLANYQIFEITGKLVLSGKLSNNDNQINVSELNSGNYIILISNEAYGNSSKTFIKK